jgi:DNA-binding transcriptional MerR regulator
MTDQAWTLDQLAELVGAALSVDYDGQASGRVRDLPDRRAIRYYTTIGLVDRPATMRGRTALYTRRHLLQLVAIKRLQAAGMSLAQVQVRLAGATDAQLEREARVPPSLPEAAAARTQAAPPAPAARPAFWKRGAAAPTAPTSGARADREPEPARSPPVPHEVASLQGLRLGEGVTLLLEREHPLDAGEVAAIRAAAAPLLEVLRRGKEPP